MKKYLFTASLIFFSGLSSAATMLQPLSATSSVGSFNTYGPQYTIDQTGLSGNYVSGVTDFSSFVSTTTTVGGASSFNGWFAPSGITTGNIDFSLGGGNIESFALWNDHQPSTGQGINQFNLWADSSSDFLSPILLGSFNATMTAEPNNFGQVFNFSPTVASYVRMEILSNHGSTFTTGFSEAAFGVSPVPLPAAVWLFGSGLLGLVGFAGRKKVV